jgi:hypothetical protein
MSAGHPTDQAAAAGAEAAAATPEQTADPAEPEQPERRSPVARLLDSFRPPEAPAEPLLPLESEPPAVLGELEHARLAEVAEVRRAARHAHLVSRAIGQLQQPERGGPRLVDLELLRELVADAQAWLAAAEAYAAARALTARAG